MQADPERAQENAPRGKRNENRQTMGLASQGEFCCYDGTQYAGRRGAGRKEACVRAFRTLPRDRGCGVRAGRQGQRGGRGPGRGGHRFSSTGLHPATADRPAPSFRCPALSATRRLRRGLLLLFTRKNNSTGKFWQPNTHVAATQTSVRVTPPRGINATWSQGHVQAVCRTNPSAWSAFPRPPPAHVANTGTGGLNSASGFRAALLSSWGPTPNG